MTSVLLFTVLEVSVITCGLVAGVFLTFSDFIMRSLDKAKTNAGIEVMQIINREVFRTVFMALLLGFSALSLILASYAYFSLTGQAATAVIAGSIIYFLGVFVVSIVFNVPMNQHLDALNFASDEASIYWQQTYLPRWTFWNYIRAISSSVSAVCFLIACILLA